MDYNPEIWFPHYWFVLQTISMTYPIKPNEECKKKYYDLIQNIPLFLPLEKMGNEFLILLDKYPVTPYLDSRDSFITWVHFIYNKTNQRNGKEYVSLENYIQNYNMNYRQDIKDMKWFYTKKKIIFLIIITLLICLIISFVNNNMTYGGRYPPVFPKIFY